MKNVKEFKQRNVSIFSWVQVYKNANNVYNKMSIYPYKSTWSVKWFWLNSTVLNLCLRTLKNVKEFKQRNVSIFSWMHIYKNATDVFKKVRIFILLSHVDENATNIFKKVRNYPCKFTSSIKWFWFISIVMNLCLKSLKNVKEFEHRNVSIFRECKFSKTQLMFLTKVSIHPCKFTSSI